MWDYFDSLSRENLLWMRTSPQMDSCSQVTSSTVCFSLSYLLLFTNTLCSHHQLFQVQKDSPDSCWACQVSILYWFRTQCPPYECELWFKWGSWLWRGLLAPHSCNLLDRALLNSLNFIFADVVWKPEVLIFNRSLWRWASWSLISAQSAISALSYNFSVTWQQLHRM